MATFPSRQQNVSVSPDSSRASQWEHWCPCPRWMAVGFGWVSTGRRLHSGVKACCRGVMRLNVKLGQLSLIVCISPVSAEPGIITVVHKPGLLTTCIAKAASLLYH